MNKSMLFLANFIKNPREVGAIAQSSKFLTKEIIRNIEPEKPQNIVELGAGLGAFTESILKKASPGSKVFCFEINKRFCRHISENLADERLIVINAGAEKLSAKLKVLNAEKADCIISGLPFFNFSESKKRKILMEVTNSLSDKGRFVLFQYTNGLGRLLHSSFSKVKRKMVPLNIPPSFVYVCEK